MMIITAPGKYKRLMMAYVLCGAVVLTVCTEALSPPQVSREARTQTVNLRILRAGLRRESSSVWGGWNIFRDDFFFRLTSPRALKPGRACALKPWSATSKRCPLTSANKNSVQSEERIGGQMPNASSCEAGLAR